MTLSVPEITPEDARQLTDRIKVGVEAVWHLITEAYTTRAYIALGYRNWDDYCTREFGTSRLRLPREERAEVVASLRESGLSIRAIESATGHSGHTIIKDIREREALQSATPDPDPILTQADREALDDTEWCDCGDGLCECVMGECSCGQAPGLPESEIETPGESAQPSDWPSAPEGPPTLPRITGTDGKSYPAPKPVESRPTNRKSLPDAFWRATFDLGKEVARIEKLADDDRFSRNAGQIKQSNLSDLTRARDALQRVIDKLTQQGV